MFGNFYSVKDFLKEIVEEKGKEGESYRSIKDQTGLALATITRIIKEEEGV